jgi:hypothetical protein
MASRSGLAPAPPRSPEGEKKRTRRFDFPWKPLLIAGIPAVLAWYYLVVAAPPELPVPPGLKVPFPELLPYLENVVVWCSERSLLTAGIALALVGSTFLTSNSTRSAIALGVLLLIGTGFFYVSIHAPVERLLRSVEQNLPEERKLPEYLPPGK